MPSPLAARVLTHCRNSLLALLGLACLASCSYSPLVEKDGAGKLVDYQAIPNATPKPEPITKAGNKSPYQVFGKTYSVMPSHKGYRETGVASWYGTKFHGRLTSNGEIYNMYAMTAAHKSLPIPTYARVTNTENGRSVIVRINDRGPFHDDRLIDLSFVAALKLGYANKGTARVLIESIDTDPKPKPKPAPTPVVQPVVANPQIVDSENSVDQESGHYLQVGAFTELSAAQQLQKKVAALTSQPIVLRTQDQLHKLWIGPIANRIELLNIKEMLKKTANLSTFSVSP